METEGGFTPESETSPEGEISPELHKAMRRSAIGMAICFEVEHLRVNGTEQSYYFLVNHFARELSLSREDGNKLNNFVQPFPNIDPQDPDRQEKVRQMISPVISSEEYDSILEMVSDYRLNSYYIPEPEFFSSEKKELRSVEKPPLLPEYAAKRDALVRELGKNAKHLFARRGILRREIREDITAKELNLAIIDMVEGKLRRRK